MDYSKDVEGLRAVAVLPIVLIHAGVDVLSGGFLGVDIFFVISGFLIMSIIAEDISAKSFSLLRFYSRRFVRILPALLVMIIIVMIAGILLLFPFGIAHLAHSAAAAATFVSNMYFWRTADYFAVSADLEVLLHTWSLGVEEQFYAFYPLFLIILARFNWKALRWGVAILVVASFLLSLGLDLNGYDKSSFYLLPPRMWELGLGGLIALNVFPAISNARLRDGLGLIGFALIIGAMLSVRPTSEFLAPWALLPCLGAALLIAYGKNAVSSHVLSFEPFLWVGRISYPLYLWHWPIIAFYRISYGIVLSPIETCLLVALSIAAAAASNSFLERPVLRRFRAVSPKTVLPIGLAASAGLLAAGLVVAKNATLWHHYPPAIERLIAYTDYTSSPDYTYQFRTGTCFIEPVDSPILRDPKCLQLSETKPNLIIAGDSFAAQYWRAFSLRFADYNVIQATAPGCRPTVQAAGAKACRAIVETVLGPIAESGKAAGIVLAGRWIASDLPKLAQTVQLLRSKNIPVLVVGPSVEYDGEYPDILARALLHDRLDMVDRLRSKRPQELNPIMKSLTVETGGKFVSPYDLECPDGQCMLKDASGAPTHFDCCHLPLSMAIELVDKFTLP